MIDALPADVRVAGRSGREVGAARPRQPDRDRLEREIGTAADAPVEPDGPIGFRQPASNASRRRRGAAAGRFVRDGAAAAQPRYLPRRWKREVILFRYDEKMCATRRGVLRSTASRSKTAVRCTRTPASPATAFPSVWKPSRVDLEAGTVGRNKRCAVPATSTAIARNCIRLVPAYDLKAFIVPANSGLAGQMDCDLSTIKGRHFSHTPNSHDRRR